VKNSQEIRGRNLIPGTIVCLATMLWPICWPQEVSAEPQPIPLAILVFNYSAASRSSVNIAGQEVSRIFRQAGLMVSWRWCPVPLTPDSDQACAAELGPNDIRLRIVNQAAPNYFGERVFGFSVAPAVATVYYEHAVNLAKSDGAEDEVPTILAYVIAHEIGHLLLGPGAHAPTGIMQAQWKREDLERAMKGLLLFRSEEIEKMSSNAMSRLAQPASTARPDFAAVRTVPELPGVTTH
jgi:hypothetical protein